MNTGLIIGIISLSLVSIVAVVVVVIRMNKKTSPTPTSARGDASGLFKPFAKRERPTSGPTVGPTSGPTITQNKVLTKTQVPPNNYTKLYEYIRGIWIGSDGVRKSETLANVANVQGYQVNYTTIYDGAYAYSLLNTSPYNITKVGFNFMTNFPQVGIWLYKLDKNKIASQRTNWKPLITDTINKLYIEDFLIEPGESFVINMKQLWDKKATANFEITFVEVLLPG